MRLQGARMGAGAGMTEWKIGLVVAPALISAMAILLMRKRAISRFGATLVLAAVWGIAALLFSM
jgi:ABC-type sulfate transport system permease component